MMFSLRSEKLFTPRAETTDDRRRTTTEGRRAPAQIEHRHTA